MEIVVCRSAFGKRRMAIDYASTINAHTELDAFPVALIPDVVSELRNSHVFSSVDLRSAYCQYLFYAS